MKGFVALLPIALALSGCGLLGSTVSSELGSVGSDLPSEVSSGPVELSTISGAGYGLICRDVVEIECIQLARQFTEPPADRHALVLIEIVGGSAAVTCTRAAGDEGEPVTCDASVLPTAGTLTTPDSGRGYGLVCRDIDDATCIAAAHGIDMVPVNAGGITIEAIEIEGDHRAIVCRSSGIPHDDDPRPVYCEIDGLPADGGLVGVSPAP